MNRKLLLSLVVVFVVIISLVGVSIKIPILQHQDSISIGNESIITFTIGNPIYGAGSPDYICDGVDDNVQFQAAMNALPVTGGKLVVLGGQYNFSASVTRLIDNITIQGMGRASYITYNAINPVFIFGGNNWIVQDLRTDAGGITVGVTTGWEWRNVTINATYYTLRTSSTGNINIGSVSVDTSIYPPLQSKRETVDTMGLNSAFEELVISSGDMVDGFGTGTTYSIQDTAGVDNPIAFWGAKRSGADNTGAIIGNIYYAGVSTNLITLDNGGIHLTRHVSMVDATNDAKIGIYYDETPTITDNSNYTGFYSSQRGVKTTAPYTGWIRGMVGVAEVGVANTQNWTDTVSVRGYHSSVHVADGSVGTITGIAAYYANYYISNTGATATNYYGFYANNRADLPLQHITNFYQVYLTNPTHGSTLNYSIYSEGGQNYFGGNIHMGESAASLVQGITYKKTYTITDNGSYTGFYPAIYGAKTSAVFTGSIRGDVSIAGLDATNTQNWTDTLGLKGIFGIITTATGSSGTITGAASFVANSAFANAATVSNYYGYYVMTPTVAGNKLTNAYGVYISNINTGLTLNYALYSAGGRVNFTGLSAYANNGLAVAGGLVVGDLYRTGADPDVVCIVH